MATAETEKKLAEIYAQDVPAAEVCWKRDEKLMHRQTWKDGKPPSSPPAENAPQVDVHSVERAGLMERLCVLAGVTTWREPVAGYTNKAGKVPNEHVLAAALAFARDHSGHARDIGPDILEVLVLGRETGAMEHITTKLMNALLDTSTRMHTIERRSLRKACYRVVRACISGRPADRINSITAHDWRFIESLGTNTLWTSAEQTLKEVARVLHM